PGRSIIDSNSRDQQSVERSRHIRQRLDTNDSGREPKNVGRPRLQEPRPLQENAGRPGRTVRPQRAEHPESASPPTRFSNREHNDKPRSDYRNARREAAAREST